MRKPFAAMIVLVLILNGIVPVVRTAIPTSASVSLVSAVQSAFEGPFRTRVAFPNSASRARLDQLGVVVLEEGLDWALVLADADQLESLARLRFQPRATDDLGLLVDAHTETAPWLAQSVQPVLARASAVRGLSSEGTLPFQIDASASALAEAKADLRAAMHALTVEQQAGITSFTSVDDDADGLTNTQEEWWCTDPLDTDSDGDGVNDGDEVAALKAWLANETAGPPAGGKPFVGWPPDHPDCYDDDQDSIPDLAERWELGLNMNRESTDRDKFDDGQELFGNTYCPGSGGYCGYGALPRNEDWGVIFAEMPSWVEAPGDHPLVAAFPVPEIDVVASSLHMEAVTTIQTDHTIISGTERSYSTAKTDGTSTSVADTETWNEWQETTVARSQSSNASLVHSSLPARNSGWFENLFKGEAEFDTAVHNCGAVSILGLSGCANIKISDFLNPEIDFTLFKDLEVNIPEIKLPDFDFSNWFQDISILDNLNISPNFCLFNCGQDTVVSNSQQEVTQVALSAESQDRLSFENQLHYAFYLDQSNNTKNRFVQHKYYPASYPLSRSSVTESTTKGKSVGGARTTTNTQYEEHTVTNGEAFSSGESWGTATAVDSAHAADLWFTYQVRNTGTEYAREICDLAFNVYIGDDLNPAYTYFVGDDLGGDGCFNTFMPDEEHEYTAHRIPLTLEQMTAVDLGGPVRIVVEDFTYGIDELFYEDAVNAGVLIAIEDGTDDNDEIIDTYLIPTWGEETVLDILARYFPHDTDAYGNVIAIWTPEYRSDTPSWCVEPRAVGAGGQRTLWCKHALSTADWWNVYLNGLGDGSEGFQDTLAGPGSVALFRFNKDSDLDGYSDRSELRLGTDPNDPASHPEPELIAGLHAIQAGDYVTTTLSFLNTGLYDAYGVEAVMIAPNNSISITNNTVGGSGRVRALRSVVVGSRILSPAYDGTTWQGTAQPFSGGYYAGSNDQIYTFTSLDAGSVGTGTLRLQWDDGAGASGTLDFGVGYASPTPLDIGNLGVQVGFLSGEIQAEDTFTVAARTPRDTFQYAINEDLHTEPVVLVSYNDPQGNHRFITPITLTTPTEDLVSYSGQMLERLGVEIVTQEPITTTGTYTTNVVVNWPAGVTLEDAHLFLEFVSISGTVAAEVPVTVTLPPGPTVVPIQWNTDSFSPTFAPNEDYIVMAFWTDWQGNIVDTAARPLSSFQADPKPSFAMAETDVTWDFGTAAQGTVLKRTFTFANTGFLDLLTYVSAPAGLTLSQQGSRRVGPADVTPYGIALNTADLPIGPYDETITLRTSDPDHPMRTVQVVGVITGGIPDTPPGAEQRPLDWDAYVPGDHNQGDWVEFTHTLGPDPQSLHPVKVYSQDYGTMWGVGEYAPPFGSGTASYEIFGDGGNGPLTISSNIVDSPIDSSCTGTAGNYTLAATNASFAVVGQKILIHQTRGSGAGNWEINKIAGYTAGTITLTDPLENSYSSSGSNKAQVLILKEYTDVTVNSGQTWSAKAWNGTTGGILAFLANGTVTVNGIIEANGRGFKGATQGSGGSGYQGEGTGGLGERQRDANGNGGGGNADYQGGSGGGGGNDNPGASGGYSSNPLAAGAGGTAAGSFDLASAVFGGGGGSAIVTQAPGNGGNGGGMVFAFARNFIATGLLTSDGTGGGLDGGSGEVGGGGGAGGSILIRAQTATLGTNRILARGGAGGVGSNSGGGNGGIGRIRVDYCESLSGSTNPLASTEKLDCYIVEQVESPPYTTTRLNLPESFTGGRHYWVQYGRLLAFNNAEELVTTLRISSTAYLTASLNALISDVGSGSLTLRLDVGDDGTWDWETTQSVDGSTTFTSTNLAHAFNGSWIAQDALLTGTVDVPVRVYLSKAGQVLLTNLMMTPTSSKVRYVRLPAQDYGSVILDLTVGESGSGSFTIAADVGDDGTVDWTYTGAPSYPAYLTTDDLALVFNDHLSGHTGEVDVPIRFYLAPFLSLSLDDFSATPSAQPDVTLTESDITFGDTTSFSLVGRGVGDEGSTEGDTILITVIVHNGGSLDADGLTAAAYATAPGWGDWYIGSAYIPEVPAGLTATATIAWNTLGFTGTVPVRVVLDLYDRLPETNEDNNEASTTFDILTRPDLLIADVALSDDEPVVNEMVVITLTLRNQGQTEAGNQAVTLYDGNPDGDGALVGEHAALPLPGGVTTIITFAWTPTTPGSYRLFAQADRDDDVNEYDEGNNETWQDIYVGLAGPILLDSGNLVADPAYTSTLGYGVVDADQPDLLLACGSDPYETLRLDPGGEVTYRFDHLLPGHFYHLDVTLYECDGAGRQESIYVDGNLIAGPEDLSDGQVYRLSILLDPALYTDRSIDVTVQAPGIDGAVVSEVNLHDIDYRYADSGGADDPEYPGDRAFGWLDGAGLTTWGILPYQSVRVDLTDNEVCYQFDALDPAKSYRINLTFWQPSGTARIQEIFIDSLDTGTVVDTGDYEIHHLSVDVPSDTYAGDGSVVICTVRTNATIGAMVNEIALEELTLTVEEVTPVAGFTASPTSGSAPLTVQFTDHSSGTITSRQWDFGDSITSTQTSPTHIYTIAGLYDVALTVSGPGGGDTLIRTDYITVYEPVEADFTTSPTTGMAPLTVNFTNTSTGDYTTSLWDFGDGLTSTVTSPTHTYTMTGAYTVTLTVSGSGGTDVLIRTNYITVSDLTPPVADFTASLTSGYAPLTVQFTDISSGVITSRRWDFGDGNTDFVANPLNIYSQLGVYDVTLTVFGPGGSDTLTRTDFITVTAVPSGTIVRLEPTAASAGVGVPITLTVAISDVQDLGSFQFTLAYDPALVWVDGVTLGEFPGSTGRTFTPVGPVISNTQGTTVFGAFSLGSTPPGPSGGDLLAHVRFLPRASGAATLHLQDVQVSNVAGEPIPILTQDGTLSIAACVGDFDGDGDIDILDVQRIAFRWPTFCGDLLYDPTYDLDGDCDIDILDVQKVAYRWGTQCSGVSMLMGHSRAPQQEATLAVLPSDRTVQAGQTFTVGVAITNAVDLGAFEFTLGYSPTVVEVVSVVLGDFPDSTGRTFTPAGPVISPTVGTVRFGAYSLGATPEGPNGNGILAILTLQALAKGESELDFIAAQVSDRAGNPQSIGDLLGGRAAVEPAVASIVKTVAPQGQVDYGDELTYTLVISAPHGTQLALYDQLEGTTWKRFVEQPTTSAITHTGGLITGTLTVTPTNHVTVSFAVEVGIPGATDRTVTVTNQACVYPFGGTLDGCAWSDPVVNDIFRPYDIFLPLVVVRNS